MIYTIGDSHATNGWENVNSVHLGPMLCYSFGINRKKFDIKTIFLKDDDIIIFCFGEIDCRCHIHKHINETNSFEKIIDDLIEKYFETIQYNIKNLQIKLKNICVFNVVPPVERKNTLENPEFPFLGNDEERKQYVLYFNKKLKEYCLKYNFLFFDVYDKYADKNGFLNKQFSDDNVHIKNGIFLNEFICQYLQ